jgi:sodium/hydrogen exchanger-like protein 6/7/sodium/hydrogen exchanger 8
MVLGKVLFTNQYREQPFSLSLKECFLVGSLLCSSDVIAAISIIKYEEQPRLFSLIFGEGIVNDAVAIILFNTVVALFDPTMSVTVVSTLGSFLLLGFASIGIGIAYGLLASYLFKHMRFLSTSAIKETLVIYCFGYLAYATGEAMHFSGIIAQLTSGIVMAHYAWYSLSPQGKHMSSATF